MSGLLLKHEDPAAVPYADQFPTGLLGPESVERIRDRLGVVREVVGRLVGVIYDQAFPKALFDDGDDDGELFGHEIREIAAYDQPGKGVVALMVDRDTPLVAWILPDQKRERVEA